MPALPRNPCTLRESCAREYRPAENPIQSQHGVSRSRRLCNASLEVIVEVHATRQACRGFLAHLRWPHGFVCPQCHGTRACLTGRGQMLCGTCRRQTSPTAGTVLHKSRIPLRGWFLAMWLACTQKTGLSAAGLQRELGLGSCRTAWLLLQKLRTALVRVDRERLAGAVEVDEAYRGEARQPA